MKRLGVAGAVTTSPRACRLPNTFGYLARTSGQAASSMPEGDHEVAGVLERVADRVSRSAMFG